MCYYGSSKASATERTADKDIVCYKTVYKPYKKDYYESEYYHFKYRIGILYEINRIIVKDCKPESGIDIEIHKAFHSFIFKVKADYYTAFCVCASGYKTIKCIIPKGAKYYRNQHSGEFASNQIKIIGEA